MRQRMLGLFTSSLLATASYAENEGFAVQVAEVKSKIQQLKETNEGLWEEIASKEGEIANFRETLENIETDIAVLNNVKENEADE